MGKEVRLSRRNAGLMMGRLRRLNDLPHGGFGSFVLTASVLIANALLMAPAFAAKWHGPWLTMSDKQHHLAEQEIEQGHRFSSLAVRYAALRDTWMNAGDPDQTNKALRPAFSAYITAAKDLEQMDQLIECHDIVVEAAMVMQIDKDLAIFSESLESAQSGVLTH